MILKAWRKVLRETLWSITNTYRASWAAAVHADAEIQNTEKDLLDKLSMSQQWGAVAKRNPTGLYQ